MSTPYPGGRNDDRGPSPMTGRPPLPEMLEFSPETIPIARPASDHPHRPATEVRQGRAHTDWLFPDLSPI